jgi:hypothetical protein
MTTTVTKESLAARIAELESGARSLKEDYTLAAYKMLLATMEAEPVAENIRIAGALAGLSWPNTALGNKAVIQAAIEALRAYRVQPAPVVAREPIAWLNDAYLARGVVDGEAGSEDAGPGYIPVYREAGPQPAPVLTFDEWCVKTNQKPQGWVRDAMKEAYEGAINQK